ncbi:MAG: glycosyltransferase family 2 protein [Bryobacteraceae bacterium]
MPRISAVMISRNEGRDLRLTLENLQDTLPANTEFLVVDDGSTDGSAEFLSRKRSGPRLFRGKNLGVAGARNLGAAHARGDVILFADAHIRVTGHWWQPMVAALEQRDAGAVSPAITDMRDAECLGYGLTLPKPDMHAKWLPRRNGKPRVVPVLPGACMAIRRRVFQISGGYDDALLASGCVDNEFCLRLFRMGYEQWVLPQIEAAHKFRRRVPYELKWPTVLHNRLRTAMVHFNPVRLSAVTYALSEWKGFGEALMLVAESGLAERRRQLEAKRLRPDHLFFERFRIAW